jgi:membrane protease YdiL (CAAX protease family)
MSTARVRRVAAAVSYPVTAVLLLALAPVHGTAPSTSPLAGALLGAAAGAALFACLTRGGCPGVLRARAARQAAAGLLPAVALAATSEEVVWRWAVLQGLVPLLGAGGAAAASIAGFAARHAQGRRARGRRLRPFLVHLATGSCFTGVALVSGRVSTAVLAHVVFNLLVVGASAGAAAAGVP